jgi:N6-L-threonylcarbamoyladenine synthase
VNVLAVETSCDETAAAVVADGRRALSEVVWSQISLHVPFGGVVPEVAARAHLEHLPGALTTAQQEAGTGWDDLHLLAVTRGPGLIGSLLVGIGLVQGLALARGLPVIGVSHLAAHVYAGFLEDPTLEPPLLGLVVSGGHSDLVAMEGWGRFRLLGRTRDDAAGEAFDKVARLLELGYPGGPAVDRLAAAGNPRAFRFPRATVPGHDFSFSGVKTAVRNEVRKRGSMHPKLRADLAASFQEAVVDALVEKTIRVLEEEGFACLVAGGGVACNTRLRTQLQERLPPHCRLVIPAPARCADNAAMVGAAAFFEHGVRGANGLDFDAEPGLGFS